MNEVKNTRKKLDEKLGSTSSKASDQATPVITPA
jgi:hypothetical protein